MQKLGEPAQALAILAKSLALAEPEGYIRVFVDEGSPMQMLLAQWLAHADASPLRDYVIQPRPLSSGKNTGQTKEV